MSNEELENAYHLRSKVGLSMADIWFEINSQRQEGQRIGILAFTKQVNNYLLTRHTLPGKVPQPLLNEAFTRDLVPDAWSQVKPKLEEGVLTIGDVDVHHGVMYIKRTVNRVIDTPYGYQAETTLNGI